MKMNVVKTALFGAFLTLGSQASFADHSGHGNHHNNPAARITDGGPRGEHCKTKGEAKGKCCKGKRMKRFFRAIDATPEQRQTIRQDVGPLRGEMKALREQMQIAKRTMHGLDRTDVNFLSNASAQADIIGSIKSQKIKLRAQIEQRIASHLTPAQLVKAREMRQRKRPCNKGKYDKKRCNKPKCKTGADGVVKCPVKAGKKM